LCKHLSVRQEPHGYLSNAGPLPPLRGVLADGTVFAIERSLKTAPRQQRRHVGDSVRLTVKVADVQLAHS